ncbi:hypothetical protein BESB_053240 [Besnoitia besnoiti]|uniref:DNA2/NAM7 helicase-like C-terminal domain-containing protein n=1 Tax=Besnoitia besnoiti TaxID=94643 RepID=A0A2A9MJ44_BESBE|nr:hypothetical protein BESB_053240 [Besnoitia besnoiti]PFH35673.1 hypothetical protein BESB_053240 [Besnoitia besnoiti]
MAESGRCAPVSLLSRGDWRRLLLLFAHLSNCFPPSSFKVSTGLSRARGGARDRSRFALLPSFPSTLSATARSRRRRERRCAPPCPHSPFCLFSSLPLSHSSVSHRCYPSTSSALLSPSCASARSPHAPRPAAGDLQTLFNSPCPSALRPFDCQFPSSSSFPEAAAVPRFAALSPFSSSSLSASPRCVSYAGATPPSSSSSALSPPHPFPFSSLSHPSAGVARCSSRAALLRFAAQSSLRLASLRSSVSWGPSISSSLCGLSSSRVAPLCRSWLSPRPATSLPPQRDARDSQPDVDRDFSRSLSASACRLAWRTAPSSRSSAASSRPFSSSPAAPLPPAASLSESPVVARCSPSTAPASSSFPCVSSFFAVPSQAALAFLQGVPPLRGGRRGGQEGRSAADSRREENGCECGDAGAGEWQQARGAATVSETATGSGERSHCRPSAAGGAAESEPGRRLSSAEATGRRKKEVRDDARANQREAATKSCAEEARGVVKTHPRRHAGGGRDEAASRGQKGRQQIEGDAPASAKNRKATKKKSPGAASGEEAAGASPSAGAAKMKKENREDAAASDLRQRKAEALWRRILATADPVQRSELLQAFPPPAVLTSAAQKRNMLLQVSPQSPASRASSSAVSKSAILRIPATTFRALSLTASQHLHASTEALSHLANTFAVCGPRSLRREGERGEDASRSDATERDEERKEEETEEANLLAFVKRGLLAEAHDLSVRLSSSLLHARWLDGAEGDLEDFDLLKREGKLVHYSYNPWTASRESYFLLFLVDTATEDLRKRARDLHGDRFDYSQLRALGLSPFTSPLAHGGGAAPPSLGPLPFPALAQRAEETQSTEAAEQGEALHSLICRGCSHAFAVEATRLVNPHSPLSCPRCGATSTASRAASLGGRETGRPGAHGDARDRRRGLQVEETPSGTETAGPVETVGSERPAGEGEAGETRGLSEGEAKRERGRKQRQDGERLWKSFVGWRKDVHRATLDGFEGGSAGPPALLLDRIWLGRRLRSHASGSATTTAVSLSPLFASAELLISLSDPRVPHGKVGLFKRQAFPRAAARDAERNCNAERSCDASSASLELLEAERRGEARTGESGDAEEASFLPLLEAPRCWVVPLAGVVPSLTEESMRVLTGLPQALEEAREEQRRLRADARKDAGDKTGGAERSSARRRVQSLLDASQPGNYALRLGCQPFLSSLASLEPAALGGAPPHASPVLTLPEAASGAAKGAPGAHTGAAEEPGGDAGEPVSGASAEGGRSASTSRGRASPPLQGDLPSSIFPFLTESQRSVVRSVLKSSSPIILVQGKCRRLKILVPARGWLLEGSAASTAQGDPTGDAVQAPILEKIRFFYLRDLCGFEVSGRFSVFPGPPGTGKTLVAACILSLWATGLDGEAASPIFAGAGTHAAVDALRTKLSRLGIRSNAVGTLEKKGAYAPASHDMFPIFPPETPRQENHCDRPAYRQRVPVFTDTVYQGRNLRSISPRRILIDEASQITEFRSLIALAHTKCTKLVLVGDPAQISGQSVVAGPVAVRSAFESFLTQSTLPHFFLLDVQFRMPDSMCELISSLFYGGLLKSHSSVLARATELAPSIPWPRRLAQSGVAAAPSSPSAGSAADAGEAASHAEAPLLVLDTAPDRVLAAGTGGFSFASLLEQLSCERQWDLRDIIARDECDVLQLLKADQRGSAWREQRNVPNAPAATRQEESASCSPPSLRNEGSVWLSYYNAAEALLTVRCALLLLRDGVRPGSIGIISPYLGQLALLERMLGKKAHRRVSRQEKSLEGHRLVRGPAPEDKILLSTVDSFQGGEKDYIIFTCVRCNREGVVGFLADWRRLNVAFSRARRGLIVIGNSVTLRQEPTFNALFNFARKLQAVVSVNDPSLREITEGVWPPPSCL